jgi:hypothetical protein
MLPWSLNSKFKCDVNQLRQLLFDAIKSLNTKINRKSVEQSAYASPIYENLVYLELTLKRYDIAIKLCDRFIKINSDLVNLIMLKLYISTLTVQWPNTKEVKLKQFKKINPHNTILSCIGVAY